LPGHSGGSDLKKSSMVVFFLIVISILGLVNFYIAYHGWQALPADASWRTVYLIALLFFSLSFVAGRILERVWVSPVSEALVWIGSYWLAAMLYFFLAAVLVDLFRLVVAFLPVFPFELRDELQIHRHWILLGTVSGVGLLLIAGHINAANPRIRELDIAIAKPLGAEKTLRIVVASDIHLGTIIGRKRFDRIVETMNSLQPDLVLFPGDIVDEDLGPVIRENLGESLRSVRARYGVFAITGNHEYIGGAEAACRYLQEHGITMLRDSTATLPNGVQLIGRQDRSSRQFGGQVRKSLESLMAGIERSRPIILLDHQPFHLDEAVEAGVDLQLSGHTHHGQIWPLNHITNAIYELSRGYLKRGSTHIYVSSGVGTWGPPVRLGNRPEILLCTLRGI
jgi:uncharacterized protein